MASNPNPAPHNAADPSAPGDLPPPYSAVVGNQQYGFVVPGPQPFPDPATTQYPHPKSYTAPGVYPHPTTVDQPHIVSIQQGPSMVPVGVMIQPAVGTEPTTITCYNCNKVVTTRVSYSTAWHTHLLAGSICVITMFCSLCCLGLIPYCFDTFKEAEHYCPECNSFIGKSNKC